MSEPETRPAAVSAPAPRGRAAWLLPLVALVGALWLAWSACSERGPLIRVTAPDGHGLEAGDPLRYRGITVGGVTAVRLGRDLDEVRIDVRLDPAAAGLARAGTRFWIVRPHVSLDGVQGIETLVGARYLAVRPGPPGGERVDEFAALAEPPLDERVEPAGLEITLEAPARFGISPGTPIAYRQIRVGTVLAVDLASDATTVEIDAYVRPAYAELVRASSVFWESGGVELEASLFGGLELDLESLRSLWAGGIAFATPTDAGPPAADGARFRLREGPPEDWRAWRPALSVGAPAGGADRPPLAPARLRWESGFFGRDRGRRGWLLPVSGGWLGPADLLQPVEAAGDEGAELEVAGERARLVEPAARAANGLAWRASAGAPADAWPRERALSSSGREAVDCLLVADPEVAPRPLAAARLVALPEGEGGGEGGGEGEGWRVEDVQLGAEWHGALVLAREGGALVGVLLVDGDGARVARVPAGFWSAE